MELSGKEGEGLPYLKVEIVGMPHQDRRYALVLPQVVETATYQCKVRSRTLRSSFTSQTATIEADIPATAATTTQELTASTTAAPTSTTTASPASTAAPRITNTTTSSGNLSFSYTSITPPRAAVARIPAREPHWIQDREVYFWALLALVVLLSTTLLAAILALVAAYGFWAPPEDTLPGPAAPSTAPSGNIQGLIPETQV